MSRRQSQTVLVSCIAVLGFVFGLLLYVYLDRQGGNPGMDVMIPEEASGSSLAEDPPLPRDLDLVDKPTPPMLAIVVDDLGYGRRGTSAILELPHRLTVSVLPNLAMTKSDYERAVRSKHQVMLHLPMEPADDEVSPGDGAIVVGMGESEIRGIIEESLEQTPGVTAVNNHMGSRATADGAVMRVVLTVLKERGLYWVDSSTTPESKGPSISRSLGMPVVINNLFLDWECTREYVEGRLLDAAQRARDKGYAVAIGHVSEVFVETLDAVLPGIESSGVALVTVDQLVDYLRSASGGHGPGQRAAEMSPETENE